MFKISAPEEEGTFSPTPDILLFQTLLTSLCNLITQPSPVRCSYLGGQLCKDEVIQVHLGISEVIQNISHKPVMVKDITSASSAS